MWHDFTRISAQRQIDPLIFWGWFANFIKCRPAVGAVLCGIL